MSSKAKISLMFAGGLALIVLLIMLGNYWYYHGKAGVEIVSVDPTGEVARKTNFTIEFSRDMIAADQQDIALDSLPILFTPSIPGRYKWISVRRLRFYPDIPLRPATEYTLEVLPEICTLENSFLEGERKFNFYTEPLKVVKIQFNVNYQDAKFSQFKVEGTLEFNDKVTPEQLTNYLTLHADEKGFGNKVPYTLDRQEPSEKFILLSETLARQKTDQYYSVRIAKGLVGLGGQLGLTEDYVSSITVGPPEPLTLLSIYPTSGEGLASWLVISFSTPIALDQARNYITLTPRIAYKMEQEGSSVYLKGPFSPGQVYTVTIQKGLVAQNQSLFEKDLVQKVFIENLEPQVNFVDQGVYLPRKGNQQVGLQAINIKNLEIEIFQIFENNLIYLLHQGSIFDGYYYFDYDYNGRYLGRRLFQKEISVQGRTNEPVVTAVNLTQFLNEARRGIYLITARDTEERWRDAMKWIIATDLGITAHKGENELLVWINSLTSLTAYANTEVTLLSQSNQIIATATTNAEGLAVIMNLKEKLADFEPFVIVASSGADLSFLKFEDCRVSTSDFDVAGRPHLVEGYEACLYTDRGIYRPGEMAHLVAVVRDRMVAIPIEFPVKLLILGPDDRLVQESRGKVGKGGACEFEIPLATYAATGKYLARLVVGENQELGRVNFSVEEFIPDRIKVTLNTDKSGYRPGETVKIEVKAVNLFGPPASGRKVEANCEVEAVTFSHPKYRSYTFEDPKKSFTKMTLNLNAAQLDTAGKYQFNLTLPTGLKPPSGLRGVLATTVTEPGGRAVSAYREIKIHPYPYYIGIRPQQEGYAQVGKPSQFDFAIIDDAGNLQNVKNLQVKIYRIVWNSILKRDSNGYFRYVSEFYEEEIQAFGVAASEGSGTVSFQPNDYGEYRLALTELTSQVSTSIQFYASGWGYAPWSMANPDRVEIAFDKQNYMPGETAKVLIKAPFAGKLLLWIEREGVLETRTLKLEKNSANIELVVKENYKPNVYVTATLIRSLKSLEKHAPVRAFGTAPLFVNCQKQQLKVELETVTDIRPRQKLQVNVKVAGASAGGLITVAAVDEGICQLTNFTTPDLHGFFYAKKRLQLEPYDIYNFLLPEFDVAKARTSVAGDLAGVRQKHLTPVDARRVKPVALWCGLTSLGTDGTAKVKFDLPEFNGSLRLMAVACDGANFGNQTQNVLVRDPIVLTPNFPRFLAPNDHFQVPVQIYNGTGKTNNFEVRLEAVGPAKIENSASQSISIKEKQEATVSFQLVAQPGLGKVKFTISAQGGGSSTSSSLEVPVRPPVSPITLTGSGMVTAAKPVTLTLPADWVSGTESYQLTTSGFPAIQFAGGLQYLLSYPHGCIEQTTSRVFPLLYFKDLARVAAPELFQTNTAEYFVEAGINQISNMQLASGGFGYWPGSTEASDWGSIYAAHFLIAARKAGYTISNQVYARMLDFVKQQARSSFIDAPDYLDLRTYALYVLATADLADKSSMIYLKNSQLAHLNASSKCFLAGAFGLSGDLKTAKELLPVTMQPQSIPRETGGIFNSGIRTNAICLMIYAELFPQNPTVPVLVKWLASQTKIGRWYTTQENAWAFMAIGKTVQKTDDSQFTGEIKSNSAVLAQFTSESKVFTDRKLGGKSLEISLQGKGTGYYYWQAAGLPRTMNIHESDNGLKVRRVFMNRTGQALNYQQIRHGDLIIAEIRMFAADKALENVIIADLLPAGLEIENPRIESREQIPWISDQDFTPDYMDLRDDRLILFVSLPERQEQIFYYALRAVTVGEFTLPPIKGEAMYDPVYSSIASSGVIRVVE